MTDDTPLPFDLPAVHRKKLTVDFDGGTQSSSGALCAPDDKFALSFWGSLRGDIIRA